MLFLRWPFSAHGSLDSVMNEHILSFPLFLALSLPLCLPLFLPASLTVLHSLHLSARTHLDFKTFIRFPAEAHTYTHTLAYLCFCEDLHRYSVNCTEPPQLTPDFDPEPDPNQILILTPTLIIHT